MRSCAARAAGCCCRGWCRSAIRSSTSGSAARSSRSDEATPIPPAIEPLERRCCSRGLIGSARRGVDAARGAAAGRRSRPDARSVAGRGGRPGAAGRLRGRPAGAVARIGRSRSISCELILDDWPSELRGAGGSTSPIAATGCSTPPRSAGATAPPAGFVCAAGITTARAGGRAAAAQRSRACREGMVVLPGARSRHGRRGMGRARAARARSRDRPAPPSIETHPQFHLKLLLDRMGVGARRGAALALGRRPRRAGGAQPGDRQCDGAAPPSPASGRRCRRAERRLTGVRALELADPAEEAQAIALALREALETPGRTAALVTPDRGLARRVSAHLRRWGIEADDSAGRPLCADAAGHACCSRWPNAAAERFAPVPLLALLKHPLVMRARRGSPGSTACAALDLRAARPAAAGRAGRDRRAISPSGDERDARMRAAALAWWREVAPLLRAARSGVRAASGRSAALLAALREAARRAGRRRGLGRAGRPRRRRAARRARGGGGERARAARRRPSCRALLEQLMAGGRGAPAVRPASAHVHLGPDRGAAAARRSDDPRRAQRRRLAGAAGARSLAGAAASAPSSACRRSSGGSALPRMISPARSARRRCWSPARGATRARRRSPRASGCGWRR